MTTLLEKPGVTTARPCREDARRLRQVLDSLFTFVAVMTPDGIVTDANLAPLVTAGLQAEDVIGRRFLDTPYFADLPGTQARLQEHVFPTVMRGMVVRENVLTRLNGVEHIFDATFTPLRDDDGHVMEIVASGVDITEATRTLHSLSEAQRIGHLGNWDWDIVTNALTWSDEIYRIFGQEPQAFPATYPAFLDTVHPEDRPAVTAAVDAAIRRERPYSIEHRVVRPDGEVRVVHEVGEVRYDAGRPVRMLGTVLDITGRRSAEDEVRRLNTQLESRVAGRTAELEVANRELEAFAYSVSHDLRAPLRSIDGFAQALEEDFGDRLDETGREYLARVRAAAGRMDRLINDILQLSRATSKPARRERVDLGALAREVVSELAEADPARQVSVTIAPGLVALGDPDLLRTVLVNLVGNAWKFTRLQSAPAIEVGRTQTADGTAFFVRDNGVGFQMAHAGRLFEAFQRLHGEGTFEGTGIGLATVKRLVSRHGGRVWAEAAADRGATFYFTLPGLREAPARP